MSPGGSEKQAWLRSSLQVGGSHATQLELGWPGVPDLLSTSTCSRLPPGERQAVWSKAHSTWS